MAMGLVDLESAYLGANVVIAKPIAENGRENVVEPVVNLERRNGDDKTSSDVQKDIKPNLKGDRLNVALLVLLYTLQGIPIGISLAIRTYMQNNKVSYGQQVYILLYFILFLFTSIKRHTAFWTEYYNIPITYQFIILFISW